MSTPNVYEFTILVSKIHKIYFDHLITPGYGIKVFL